MRIGAMLFMLGTLPFLVLGSIHLWYTVLDERAPKRFAPRDAATLEGMQRSALGLTTATTVWRAGLGFHYSHSLGVLLFGTLYLGLALRDFDALAHDAFLAPLALIVGWSLVLLAWRYWFRIPLAGTLIGSVLLSLGLALPAGARPAAEPPLSGRPLEVVFICQYGNAKSLVAAKHFERMAAERGVKVRVYALGVTPKDSVSEVVAAGLRADGLDVPGFLPRPVSQRQMDEADIVVTFGVWSPLPASVRTQRIDDVGSLDEDYPKARDQIRAHLAKLLDKLTAPF